MAKLDLTFGLGNVEEEQYMQETLMEAEMTLQNCSFGFEYARLELQGIRNDRVEEEILLKMEYFKKAYFAARNLLAEYDPFRLEQVEFDILQQKQEYFNENEYLHS